MSPSRAWPNNHLPHLHAAGSPHRRGSAQPASIAASRNQACSTSRSSSQNRVAPSPGSSRKIRWSRHRSLSIACTCARGLAAAKKTATLLARHIGVPSHHVFIGSTGVIGRVLPVNRITKGIPQLLTHLSDRGGLDAARAIMTTDLRPKSIAIQDSIGGCLITIGGMAKGSGMIHPNMATMLAYFTTDASITRSALQQAISLAVN